MNKQPMQLPRSLFIAKFAMDNMLLLPFLVDAALLHFFFFLFLSEVLCPFYRCSPVRIKMLRGSY